MNFEITKEYLDKLNEEIKNERSSNAIAMLNDLHPADIADVLEELENDHARYIFMQLEPSKAADILAEIEEDDIERFLKSVPGEIIANELIGKMDSDDATDVLQSIPTQLKDDILSHLEDFEHAGDIADLLTYDENTAGGLMAKELFKVKDSWDVNTCITELRRQDEELNDAFYVYVTDDSDIFLGVLPIKKLILNHGKVRVHDLLESDAIAVKTDTRREEVANIMDKYALFALPVLDSINRLVGRITIDDVVDVIREEAEKDYQMISGITQDVESSDSTFKQSKARIPWLLIGMIGGIFGSRIIGLFENEIHHFAGLALFLPLIAAMGGNVGVQSSSIIVQSIANNTLGHESNAKKLGKEFLGGMLNGIICSGIIFLYNLFFGSSFALTLAVSMALFTVIISASILGTFIPLILHRFKIDPALATGPFITTINDITGLFIYLLIARSLFPFF